MAQYDRFTEITQRVNWRTAAFVQLLYSAITCLLTTAVSLITSWSHITTKSITTDNQSSGEKLLTNGSDWSCGSVQPTASVIYERRPGRSMFSICLAVA
jgi:hypothetical protein